ncbi:hypothetical protein [Burkholderia gladioli]|uniref:hypothetical protein n=1 Tax=Burkholderia gladioli TaxID=28095 RepID=UPI0016415507|nr:hypothetical protein [Burkholderia gladioli]
MGQARQRGSREERVAQAIQRQKNAEEANVGTEALFLLDRNVISVIKHSLANKEQKGDKEERMLAHLKEIDAPQNAISPIMSLMEGEKGRPDSPTEKDEQVEKETDVVSRFFKRARTDSSHLINNKEIFIKIFSGYREGSSDARAAFREKAIEVVFNKVPSNKRRSAENLLFRTAEFCGLNKNDVIVVMFIACLYENDDARDILKLKDLHKIHNVLSDIYLIPRIGLVKWVAESQNMRIKIKLLTLDEGLEKVLSNVKVSWRLDRGQSEPDLFVEYLPELFTALPENDARALLGRLADITVKD